MDNKCGHRSSITNHIKAKSCKSRPACHVKMTIGLLVGVSSTGVHRYCNMNNIEHFTLISFMLCIKDSFSSSLVYR